MSGFIVTQHLLTSLYLLASYIYHPTLAPGAKVSGIGGFEGSGGVWVSSSSVAA